VGSALKTQQAVANNAHTKNFSFIPEIPTISANVEMIRVNDGAARAPHETCPRKTPDPMIG
jgi:hypothetical protein